MRPILNRDPLSVCLGLTLSPPTHLLGARYTGVFVCLFLGRVPRVQVSRFTQPVTLAHIKDMPKASIRYLRHWAIKH